MKLVVPKVTVFIVERLAQRKGSVVPSVYEFMSKCPLGAKSGSTFERLATMKSGKVDSAAKVELGPIPHFAVIDSSAKKGKSARMDSCERYTKSEAEKFLEVYALLKAYLLEDIVTCAMFIDSVGKVVVRSYSLAKHLAYSMRSSLIATMHKTLILVGESMRIDQDAVKCPKEAEVALVAQLRSAAEKIEKLESELAILKGSDVSAPTSVQLEIAHQEVIDLKTRRSVTQVMLEALEKEVSLASLVVEDLERVNLEPRSICFAKDDELIFMHVEVSRLNEVASELESKEVDLQGALSTSENLKKELDELQGAHIGLLRRMCS